MTTNCTRPPVGYAYLFHNAGLTNNITAHARHLPDTVEHGITVHGLTLHLPGAGPATAYLTNNIATYGTLNSGHPVFIQGRPHGPAIYLAYPTTDTPDTIELPIDLHPDTVIDTLPDGTIATINPTLQTLTIIEPAQAWDPHGHPVPAAYRLTETHLTLTVAHTTHHHPVLADPAFSTRPIPGRERIG
jgi:hypothetical protein